MQRLGLRERLHESEVIDEAWSKIVGDFIAAHPAPVTLRERHSLRSGASASPALRARAAVQNRHLESRQNASGQKHPRHSFPDWLICIAKRPDASLGMQAVRL
jgi:hypothetical protein